MLAAMAAVCCSPGCCCCDTVSYFPSLSLKLLSTLYIGNIFDYDLKITE